MIVSVCSFSCEFECKLLLLLIYSLVLFSPSSFQILSHPISLYSPPQPPLPFRLTLDLCYCSESCDICDFNLPPWVEKGRGREGRGKSVFISGPFGQRTRQLRPSAENCLELAQRAAATVLNAVLCTFTWSYIFYELSRNYKSMERQLFMNFYKPPLVSL